MVPLSGKVVVITGAAGGLGRALAIQLADAGCDLALVDVQGEPLRRSGAACRARGAQVSTHVVDVSDRSAMAALAERVVAFHGGVDILINNAGVLTAATLLEQSEADWDWILGINLGGVITGCRVFLPHLLSAEAGQIVNISSVFGLLGCPTQVAYCTTKFAVRGLSEALAAEMYGTGVSVSCVYPGMIQTGIIASARMADADGTVRARLSRTFERLGCSPDAAAAIIVAGVRQRRSRIFVGREAHLADWVHRLAPVLGSRLMARLAQRGRAGRQPT